MSIEIEWTNQNQTETNVEIYRSITAIDSLNLPAPLVVLTGNETKFIDHNVVYGVKYFYLIIARAKDDSDYASTRNMEVIAGLGSGPGPNTLIYGN